jgi:hypothetical protein
MVWVIGLYEGGNTTKVTASHLESTASDLSLLGVLVSEGIEARYATVAYILYMAHAHKA